jgi:Protein of unknown function (DUF551)
MSIDDLLETLENCLCGKTANYHLCQPCLEKERETNWQNGLKVIQATLTNHDYYKAGCRFTSSMRWHSVKDKLPEFNVNVLVASGDDIFVAACFDHSIIDEPIDWYTNEGNGVDPTHWQPLPALPMQEVNNDK